MKRWNTASRSARGTPGPSSATDSVASRADPRQRHVDPLLGVLQRVAEQLVDDARDDTRRCGDEHALVDDAVSVTSLLVEHRRGGRDAIIA